MSLEQTDEMRISGAILVMLLVVFLVAGAGCAPAESEKPDIFLIIIDTLRADHLGCYGYYRNTSPVLDSLAAAGTMFTRFQALSPWTLPSCASIWTGLTPRSHMAGMRELVSYGVHPELDNIATILKPQGYITLGFVNSLLLGRNVGFANGFDHYSCSISGHGRAGETVDEVIEWFYANRGNPRPKLTVIHLFDVHAPYDPPAGFDTRFSTEGSTDVTDWETDSLNRLLNPDDLDHLTDMYDGEIAWVDSQLGRLFAELRRTGIADNALIIVTSDHGEEFLDHGSYSHAHSLYQELLHVPLIIAGPGIPAGIQDSVPCGQFDILPVIAGFAGVPVPLQVEGVDLFQAPPSRRIIPSSGVIRGHFPTDPNADFGAICSVLSWPFKAVVNFKTMEEALYDLSSDPGELSPMGIDSVLMGELEYYWSTPPLVIPPIVSDDAVDNNLRDLGYIN
jgi:arylsulfatase A-like enzyme